MEGRMKEMTCSNAWMDHIEIEEMIASQRNYEACRQILRIVSEIDQKMARSIA